MVIALPPCIRRRHGQRIAVGRGVGIAGRRVGDDVAADRRRILARRSPHRRAPRAAGWTTSVASPSSATAAPSGSVAVHRHRDSGPACEASFGSVPLMTPVAGSIVSPGGRPVAVNVSGSPSGSTMYDPTFTAAGVAPSVAAHVGDDVERIARRDRVGRRPRVRRIDHHRRVVDADDRDHQTSPHAVPPLPSDTVVGDSLRRALAGVEPVVRRPRRELYEPSLFMVSSAPDGSVMAEPRRKDCAVDLGDGDRVAVEVVVLAEWCRASRRRRGRAVLGDGVDIVDRIRRVVDVAEIEDRWSAARRWSRTH